MAEDHSYISNDDLADVLERIAELLELREANPFRVGSYRAAAREIRALDRAAWRLHEEGGRPALREIPGVGEGISAVIEELLETGNSRLVERLEEEASPELAFQRLPGVGPTLASRIHDELGVHTLEDMERTAHDGRLEELHGIGRKRAEGIRDALAGILGRAGRRAPSREPPVSLFLEIDEAYRSAAEADALPRIAPRRFNPEGRRWLSLLETERSGWDITALFSNTHRAHELGRTRDWVVIYYHRDGNDGQCTVVTSNFPGLEGRRVVRGREPECREYYASTP
ncbi:MAG: helix-hairpin-helix domain-containing protein [Gemmatimonadota bacterium]